MAVTAKVMVQAKSETADSSGGSSFTLNFVADYRSELNKQWAKYTPSLNFSLNVLPEVAENFKVGQSFTVTFTPDESE